MIYTFLADGFEEIEALTPVDFLRRCSLEVVTVGVTCKQVTGSHNITVIADVLPEEVNLSKAEMIILPGGMPGAKNLESAQIVQNAIAHCVRENKFIAAMCAAPFILGHAGILKGKKATCFPGFEKELDGAVLSEKPVCVDGKIITAKGVGVASQFAFTLVELLCSKEIANMLKEKVQWEK